MILKNAIIAKGPYKQVTHISNEVLQLMSGDQAHKSVLYDKKLHKKIKSLKAESVIFNHDESSIKITFDYSNLNVYEFIKQFSKLGADIITYTESEKQQIWIVSDPQSIKDYQFIPEWAIQEILIDYMNYKESSIILDSFENIQFDRNTLKITINKIKVLEGDLHNIFFNKTIKGKYVYNLLESFVTSYHQKSINTYDALYSSSKEKIDREEPSPLALFIVTFGIFAIIGIIMVTMGYF